MEKEALKKKKDADAAAKYARRATLDSWLKSKGWSLKKGKGGNITQRSLAAYLKDGTKDHAWAKARVCERREGGVGPTSAMEKDESDDEAEEMELQNEGSDSDLDDESDDEGDEKDEKEEQALEEEEGEEGAAPSVSTTFPSLPITSMALTPRLACRVGPGGRERPSRAILTSTALRSRGASTLIG